MCINSYHASHCERENAFRGNGRRCHEFELDIAGAMRLYGIEYEVAFRNYDRAWGERMSDYLRDAVGGRLKCETDGSVSSGFECISYPATLGCHRNSYGWKHFFEVLHSDDENHRPKTTIAGNNGMHVHVSRASLGTTDRTQRLAIMKMVYLLDKFVRVFTTLGGRDYSDASRGQYCYRNGAGIVDTDSSEVAMEKADSTGRTRYRAVNMQNSTTVEIRIFAVDNKYETFLGRLELVDWLVETAKTVSFDKLRRMSESQVIQSMDATQWPALHALSIAKGLITEDGTVMAA